MERIAASYAKLPSPASVVFFSSVGVVSFFFSGSFPQSPSSSFGRTQLPVLRLNPKVPLSPAVLPSPAASLLLLRLLASSNCMDIEWYVESPSYCWSQANLAVSHVSYFLPLKGPFMDAPLVKVPKSRQLTGGTGTSALLAAS